MDGIPAFSVSKAGLSSYAEGRRLAVATVAVFSGPGRQGRGEVAAPD
jgi:hypothetical protein